MLIGVVLWVLVGLGMWVEFVLSNWPKHPMEWLCDFIFALPFALVFGPVLLATRMLK